MTGTAWPTLCGSCWACDNTACRAAADYVTRHHDRDGVAHALRELLGL